MTATTDLPMMCVSFLGEAEIARRVYHTVAARRNACAACGPALRSCISCDSWIVFLEALTNDPRITRNTRKQRRDTENGKRIEELKLVKAV